MGDIIHNLDNAVFSAHVYTQVFTTASTSLILNGTAVTLAPPMVLNMRVRSLSASTPSNVYVIGDAIPNDILDSDKQIIL